MYAGVFDGVARHGLCGSFKRLDQMRRHLEGPFFKIRHQISMAMMRALNFRSMHIEEANQINAVITWNADTTPL